MSFIGTLIRRHLEANALESDARNGYIAFHDLAHIVLEAAGIPENQRSFRGEEMALVVELVLFGQPYNGDEMPEYRLSYYQSTGQSEAERQEVEQKLIRFRKMYFEPAFRESARLEALRKLANMRYPGTFLSDEVMQSLFANSRRMGDHFPTYRLESLSLAEGQFRHISPEAHTRMNHQAASHAQRERYPALTSKEIEELYALATAVRDHAAAHDRNLKAMLESVNLSRLLITPVNHILPPGLQQMDMPGVRRNLHTVKHPTALSI